ncbi:helix-turn-helix domain-containing protein [Parvibaculaceae bacterium PLY_AMNH_Bact1]|nr:helix-turn-helix domain-containing protein [Parvibaculaceae bacterium PLY_AMNH_Bact1]
MKNRIRHYRRQMGLTQTDLAKLLGTTAATVSRLETDGIKISVDWLAPLAKIFQVQLTDLIDEPSPERIEMLGELSVGGAVVMPKKSLDTGFLLHVPATVPIAVQVKHDIGRYTAGALLIADRLAGDDIKQALDQDCLVGLRGGKTFLRRLIQSPKNGARFGLVPLEPGIETKYVSQLTWCAPIVMSVLYF